MQYQVLLDMQLHSLCSALSSSVLSKFESKLEELISVELTRRGIELGSSSKSPFGKPDFVIKGERIALFIHGCFWHRHHTCQKNRIPKTNNYHWISQFNRTVIRDSEVRHQLISDGWVCIIIWGCSIKSDLSKCVFEVANFIQGYKAGSTRSLTLVI